MTKLTNQEKLKKIKTLIKNPNKINKKTSITKELIYDLLDYLNENYQIYSYNTNKKKLKKCYSEHKVLFQNLVKNSKNPNSCYSLIKFFPLLYTYASSKAKALHIDYLIRNKKIDFVDSYLRKEKLDVILELLKLSAKHYFYLPKELQYNSYIKDYVFQYGYNRISLLEKISVKKMTQFQSEGILYENPYKISCFKESKFKNKLYDFAFSLNPNIISNKFIPNKKILLKSVFDFKKTDDMIFYKNPSIELQKKFISLFPNELGSLKKIDDCVLKEIIDLKLSKNETFDYYDIRNLSNNQIEYIYFNHNSLLNSIVRQQISKNFLLKILSTQTFSQYKQVNSTIFNKFFEQPNFDLKSIPLKILLSSYILSTSTFELLLKRKNKKSSLKIFADNVVDLDINSLSEDDIDCIERNLYTFCYNYSYSIDQEKDPVCINNYIAICSKLLTFTKNTRRVMDINDFINQAKENKNYHKNDALLIMDLIS